MANLANDYGYGQIAIYLVWNGYAILRSKRVDFDGCDRCPHPSFVLGTYYQRMYASDIYNSKSRHIALGTNKEKKFSLYMYQLSNQEPLEKLLNDSKEGKLSANLTSKQKPSSLEVMRKNRSASAIGDEPWEKLEAMI
ncbi:hypothetical protein O181_042816 [Austropuccinia psidii MF-1]|uniref:Uncharacterized protein n=1 Tax=Austropuccinia psidii MF-1 TaxID=1389203 RepID=A0A9Q3DFJ5_9BASI|nr:hypothetical protein [Austropuccinia psidii MF-1]